MILGEGGTNDEIVPYLDWDDHYMIVSKVIELYIYTHKKVNFTICKLLKKKLKIRSIFTKKCLQINV